MRFFSVTALAAAMLVNPVVGSVHTQVHKAKFFADQIPQTADFVGKNEPATVINDAAKHTSFVTMGAPTETAGL